MPAYEYIERGRSVIRVVPVDKRDNWPNRVKVPSRILVCPRGEPTQSEQVLRGWYRCEESSGTEKVRQAAKSLGLTRDQVKKVWARQAAKRN